jgi:hypothetical protein
VVLACAAEPTGSDGSGDDGVGGTAVDGGDSTGGLPDGTGATGVGGVGDPGTGGGVSTGGVATGPTDGGLNRTTCDQPEVAWIGPPSEPNMITDMEISGQEFQPPVTSTGSVTGRWYTFNDGTSTNQTPASGGVFVTARICPARTEYSVRGAHTWGSGFTGYGAGEGFWVNKPSADEPLPYDASTFSGIRFWVAGNAPSMRVRIVSWHESSSCTSQDCNRHSAPVSVAAGWTQYVLTWAEFTHEAGTGTTFNPAQFYGVEFLVPGLPGGNTFDFWVDDVAFF